MDLLSYRKLYIGVVCCMRVNSPDRIISRLCDRDYLGLQRTGRHACRSQWPIRSGTLIMIDRARRCWNRRSLLRCHRVYGSSRRSGPFQGGTCEARRTFVTSSSFVCTVNEVACHSRSKLSHDYRSKYRAYLDNLSAAPAVCPMLSLIKSLIHLDQVP